MEFALIYFGGILAIFILVVFLAIAEELLGLQQRTLVDPFSSTLLVILFPIYLASAVRRLHDLGYSGWYILLGFVPCISFIMFLALLFAPKRTQLNAPFQATSKLQ